MSAGWVWCCNQCHWVWFELGRGPRDERGYPLEELVCTRCEHRQMGSGDR